MSASLGAGILFEAETIDFRIGYSPTSLDSLLWEIDGTYYFSNIGDDPVNQVISFPIPLSTGVSAPVLHSLESLATEDNGSVEFISLANGRLIFALDLPPQSYCPVKIVYSQSAVSDSVSYILTTANTWGRSLPYASYTLSVQKPLALTSIPLPSPEITENAEFRNYAWSFTDYRPEKDFRVKIMRP